MKWDPQVYASFGDERSRPFHELVARIGAQAPRRVVDLGCGPRAATLPVDHDVAGSFRPGALPDIMINAQGCSGLTCSQ